MVGSDPKQLVASLSALNGAEKLETSMKNWHSNVPKEVNNDIENIIKIAISNSKNMNTIAAVDNRKFLEDEENVLPNKTHKDKALPGM